MNHPTFFIDRLLELRDREERAALARLRRGLVHRTIDFEALAVIGAWLPAGATRREIERYLLVAMLFALHDNHTPEGDFGEALRRLRGVLQSGHESLDRRFAGLLNAPGEDLSIHLRQLIQQMYGKEVPVPYINLLNGILRWEIADRPYQQRWARSYWVSDNPDTEHQTS